MLRESKRTVRGGYGIEVNSVTVHDNGLRTQLLVRKRRHEKMQQDTDPVGAARDPESPSNMNKPLSRESRRRAQSAFGKLDGMLDARKEKLLKVNHELSSIILAAQNVKRTHNLEDNEREVAMLATPKRVQNKIQQFRKQQANFQMYSDSIAGLCRTSLATIKRFEETDGMAFRVKGYQEQIKTLTKKYEDATEGHGDLLEQKTTLKNLVDHMQTEADEHKKHITAYLDRIKLMKAEKSKFTDQIQRLKVKLSAVQKISSGGRPREGGAIGAKKATEHRSVQTDPVDVQDLAQPETGAVDAIMHSLGRNAPSASPPPMIITARKPKRRVVRAVKRPPKRRSKSATKSKGSAPSKQAGKRGRGKGKGKKSKKGAGRGRRAAARSQQGEGKVDLDAPSDMDAVNLGTGATPVAGTSTPDVGDSNPDTGTSNPDVGTSTPGTGTSKPGMGTSILGMGASTLGASNHGANGPPLLSAEAGKWKRKYHAEVKHSEAQREHLVLAVAEKDRATLHLDTLQSRIMLLEIKHKDMLTALKLAHSQANAAKADAAKARADMRAWQSNRSPRPTAHSPRPTNTTPSSSAPPPQRPSTPPLPDRPELDRPPTNTITNSSSNTINNTTNTNTNTTTGAVRPQSFDVTVIQNSAGTTPTTTTPTTSANNATTTSTSTPSHTHTWVARPSTAPLGRRQPTLSLVTTPKATRKPYTYSQQRNKWPESHKDFGGRGSARPKSATVVSIGSESFNLNESFAFAEHERPVLPDVATKMYEMLQTLTDTAKQIDKRKDYLTSGQFRMSMQNMRQGATVLRRLLESRYPSLRPRPKTFRASFQPVARRLPPSAEDHAKAAAAHLKKKHQKKQEEKERQKQQQYQQQVQTFSQQYLQHQQQYKQHQNQHQDESVKATPKLEPERPPSAEAGLQEALASRLTPKPKRPSSAGGGLSSSIMPPMSGALMRLTKVKRRRRPASAKARSTPQRPEPDVGKELFLSKNPEESPSRPVTQRRNNRPLSGLRRRPQSARVRGEGEGESARDAQLSEAISGLQIAPPGETLVNS